MKRYKVTKISDIDFPRDLAFLNSPLGCFCREIDHKGWLEADEGSLGQQLMEMFVQQLQSPALVAEWYEVDVLAEFQQEVSDREWAKEQCLQMELAQLTAPPKLPRYKAYREINGNRQGLIGFNWVDIPQ